MEYSWETWRNADSIASIKIIPGGSHDGFAQCRFSRRHFVFLQRLRAIVRDNDTEWKLIHDTGGTVSIAGYVESLMGHGIPPIQKAIDTGIRPSLSVDVETSVPNDFFSQMRTVFSLQKREVWERRHAGDKNPPAFLTVREVLEFATIQGARANGLDRKIGTLTPGKEADIILLRTDRLNVMPMNNAVGAVVSNMGPQNVDTVLIAGKVMKRNGQMLGLDFARLERLGDEARDRVYAAAKVKNARI